MHIKLSQLGTVSNHLVHPDGDSGTDDCKVRIIATAQGGSARTLVRCIFTGITSHVAPASVRGF